MPFMFLPFLLPAAAGALGVHLWHKYHHKGRR